MVLTNEDTGAFGESFPVPVARVPLLVSQKSLPCPLGAWVGSSRETMRWSVRAAVRGRRWWQGREPIACDARRASGHVRATLSGMALGVGAPVLKRVAWEMVRDGFGGQRCRWGYGQSSQDSVGSRRGQGLGRRQRGSGCRRGCCRLGGGCGWRSFWWIGGSGCDIVYQLLDVDLASPILRGRSWDRCSGRDVYPFRGLGGGHGRAGRGRAPRG